MIKIFAMFSDISKLPVKPALWFRTTDPNIWEKLSNKDTGVDIVYFFQIHNQPKIEKDIIKTIHPNGTVVQDVVESVWDFEGGKSHFFWPMMMMKKHFCRVEIIFSL